MSSQTIQIGTAGVIFMIIFGVVVVLISYLDYKGFIKLKKSLLYIPLALIVGAGILYAFLKVINIFF